MADSKFKRMIKTLPSFYKAEIATVIGGLLKSWAISDDNIEIQIKNTKDQIFVKEAEGRNLDRLGDNVGVNRSPELGIADSDYRKLVPVLSFFPKQVRKTIVALLDVFWGPGFTRPNINSGNTGPFAFGTATIIGGTANFIKDSTTVRGTGSAFLTEVQAGQYIKPLGFDGTTYAKVSSVIDDDTIELSLPWAHDIAINSDIATGAIRELEYEVDSGRITKTLRFIPNAFSDLTAVTISELINFINNDPEHSPHITASEFLDPILGSKFNLRTNTPGLQGSIQILGGDSNTPMRFNFPLDEQIETRAKVIEVNPNEIIIQIPSSVPVLRRGLKGSSHSKDTKAEIFSSDEIFDFASLGANSTLEITIDGTAYVVNFNHAAQFNDPARVTSEEIADVINGQLLFLQAFAKSHKSVSALGLRTTEGSSEYQVTGGTANSLLNFDTTLQQDLDIIDVDFPSSYIFDPVGQLFTVTRVNSNLSTQVDNGTVQSTITLDDASSFPNSPGKLLLNFGRSQQEGPISYTSRPNNSTLLIDASHIFQDTHTTGRQVNLISDSPTLPRLTGDDYAVYAVGTDEAREAAQELIKKLLAAGVVVRFVIDFPEFLFVCSCEGCGPSESADQRGSLTDQGPLVF
jgi:hypothetical protein